MDEMGTSSGKSSTGMDEKTAAGLSSLCGVIGFAIVPLVLFFIEKDSKFVKFVSMQALLCTAVAVILSILGSILAVFIIGFLLFPLAAVPWIFNIILTIKAFNNEVYKIPVIGNLAEQWTGGTR